MRSNPPRLGSGRKLSQAQRKDAIKLKGIVGSEEIWQRMLFSASLAFEIWKVVPEGLGDSVELPSHEERLEMVWG